MAESKSRTQPADTMWERAGESRLKIWILIDANRALVTGGILVATYLILVVMHIIGPTTLEDLFLSNALGTVFGSVIIAVITSVTLVLTVAQLVLSEQLDDLGRHEERMEGEIEFRERIEEMGDVDVTPAQPSRFLQTLVTLTEERAEEIADTIRESGNDEELAEIVEYTDGLIEHSQQTKDELGGAEFGSFQVLLPVLNFNYAWKIHTARILRADYADSLSAEMDEAFDDLITILYFFAPAREYFKSQYFQWEIINIARMTLYGAMPALAISGYMVFTFDAQAIAGMIFGVSIAYLVASAIYVITLLPFAILLAYILRILTVIKRTLSIGPFILREAETATVDEAAER